MVPNLQKDVNNRCMFYFWSSTQALLFLKRSAECARLELEGDSITNEIDTGNNFCVTTIDLWCMSVLLLRLLTVFA